MMSDRYPPDPHYLEHSMAPLIVDGSEDMLSRREEPEELSIDGGQEND